MESMHQQYIDIMLMPYPFFISMLDWKEKIEKEKHKIVDERSKEIKSKYKSKQAVDMHNAKIKAKRRK